jgi:hypothetical protein
MATQLVVLQKPAYGQPCNGCGWCCQQELCQLARNCFGEDYPAPCPVLVVRDGRHWCGMVEEADRHNVSFGAHWRWMLGMGVGCLVEDEA